MKTTRRGLPSRDGNTRENNFGRSRRNHYTIKKKRAVLQAIKGKTEREAAWSEGIPCWTLNDLRKDEKSIFAYEGSEKTLSRAPGRPETVPFGGELITFMKDARRDSEVLTAKMMACYVRDQYPDWLESYMVGKKDAATAYESLLRLLRRFAYRHGFVQRTPSDLKEKLTDLVALRDEFAEMFKEKYVGYEASTVFNTDKTGIYFDMPPSKTAF
ncbi:hypothetical protein PF005_g12161 [Phytophthora fragariae]|uniref:DDE-1 domain-containing protein n=1 Tax=Phytophthora fragariae TaxID=53985 RepID=A0A6A3XUK5_9STRA|nr:hypothetical protein PF005_g12161 [Phytophthora fragariae]